MHPRKIGAKKFLACACGYKEEATETIGKEIVKSEHKEVVVIEKDRQVHPIVAAKCPKCSNPNSYFWEVQTRAADEPSTKFHRCTKCSHTWRDYS